MNNTIEKKEELLSIDNLVIEYDTDDGIVKAVNGVSFNLKKGETLGLVGETGAGKTTIARAILGILPETSARVKDGSIVFKGEDLLKLPERRMRKIRGHEIAMIFQDPMSALNPVYTVGEQIAEAIRTHRNESRLEATRLASEMLELVGIPRTRFKDYPHQFSGGMKQRVVIAIALACNPELLLADEPTTALDVTIQAQVLELMADLKKKLNTSVVMITHDFGVVAQTCDRVAVIYGGKVMEIGTKREIFHTPSHPYTRGLFASLPRIDRDDEVLKTIPGQMVNPMEYPDGCPFASRCERATEECRSGNIPVTNLSEDHHVACIHLQTEEQL